MAKAVDLAKIMKFGTNSGTQQNFEALDSTFKDAVIAAATEYNSVTIWFVLKENRNCILNVYSSSSGGSAMLTGTQASGIGIGDHVFIYCITATGGTMIPATNYYYDINFGSTSSISSIIF
jgi:hypothetical protein